MALLSGTPDLVSICAAVGSNANNNLQDCLDYAMPFRFDPDFLQYGNSQLKFAFYGDTVVSLSASALNFTWNTTYTKQSVTVTSNKRWYLSGSWSGFTVDVLGLNNQVVTDGIYTSGMSIRAVPTAWNYGSNVKTAYIVVTAWDGAAIQDGTITVTQACETGAPPPEPAAIGVVCGDGTFTLTVGTCSTRPYATSLTFTVKPANYATPFSFGITWRYGDSSIYYAGHRNGIQTTLTMNLIVPIPAGGGSGAIIGTTT